jgi:outer membrane protein assembly factor BamB
MKRSVSSITGHSDATQRVAAPGLGVLLVLALVSCDWWQSNSSGESDRDRIRWHVKGIKGFGTPAVDSGAVFFTGFLHEVWAVDKRSGAVRWKTTLPVNRANNFGQGCILAGGILVVGDEDLFGLDPATGRTLWRFRPAEGRHPGLFLPAAAGSLVFGGSSSGYVYAVDARSGSLVWRTRVVPGDSTSVYHPVVHGTDVVVAFTDFNNSGARESRGGIAVLHGSTGTVRWMRYLPERADTNVSTATIEPVVVGDVIVAGARDGPMYALRHADGSLAWSLPGLGIPRPPQTLVLDLRPLATNGELAIVGSQEPVLLGADPQDGSVRWRFNATMGSTGWLAAKDDVVVLVSAGGQVELIDARSGKLRWRAPDEVSATYAPAIDSTALYLGGVNGLFAIAR